MKNVKEELRLRRGTYIGGHHAAAIMDAHPFADIADVWLELTGTKRMPDISGDPMVRRGLIIEPGLLDWIVESRGLDDVRRDVFVKSDSLHCGGTIDMMATENGKRQLFEVTSITSRGVDKWRDGPAEYKRIQALYYASILAHSCGSVVSSIEIVCFVTDTGEIIEHSIPFDFDSQAEAEKIRKACELFWLQNITTMEKPMINAAALGARTDDAAKKLYPNSNPDLVADATPDLIKLCEDYKRESATEKEAKAGKSTYAGQIKEALGEAGIAKWDGGKVTWKPTKDRTSTDWESMAMSLLRGVSDEDKRKKIADYSETRPGSRTLRVTIK